MTIYLVRHDAIALKGYCYGQTDLPPSRPFSESAVELRKHLPNSPTAIFSSPLYRCLGLANACYKTASITEDPRLMEVDFGEWEHQPWDTLPRNELDHWAMAPTDYQLPGGEHLQTFKVRIEEFAHQNLRHQRDQVVFTHAGVIRVLCAWHQQQPWHNWLNFSIPFLSVTCLTEEQIDQTFRPEIC